MKKKNRLAAILLSAAMAVGLLAGCGGGQAANDVAAPDATRDVNASEWACQDGAEQAETAGGAMTVSVGMRTDGMQPEKTSDREQTEAFVGAAPEQPASVKPFRELSAEEITAQMGAGWNLGNQLEASIGGMVYETAWNNPVITPELLQFVKAQGFSTVRIPVSYLRHIGTEQSGYHIDENWMVRVNQVVDYAIDAGLYVIINVHGDGYGTVDGGWLLPHQSDQEEILKKYAAVWRQIATRYKDYDEHLIFESMNEIGAESNCSDSLYKNINAYNQTFLDTVRQTGGNNDRRWVLVPGYNTNIDKTTDGSGFVLPKDTYLSGNVAAGEHRIMVSVHYYDPWGFCGAENDDATQWGVDADSTKTAGWGDEVYMEQQFAKLHEKFSSQGYPVVIGEYGSIDKSPADAQNTAFRVHFASKVCEKAVKYGLVPVYWDNGYNGKYGFGLFQRQTISVTQPEIVAAIIEAFDDGGEKEDGTATGITLSAQHLTMTEGVGSEQLTAVLTPAGCTDRVVWSSSNDAVATVTRDGFVRANGVGSAVITAKCNGHAAQCTVTVEKAAVTTVNLYLLETQGWQTASGDKAVMVSGNGSYFVTMKVSAEMLRNIGSFYFKDAKVQAGTLEKSLMKSGKLTVDAITINGKKLTLTGNAANVPAIYEECFDYCLLNRWATGNEAFKEFVIMQDGDYSFSGVELLDTNEITVNFTVSEVQY